MKLLAFALLASLLSLLRAPEAPDTMTTAKYKALLDKVESSRNKLEPAFKGIDPSKTNISYTAGKQIEGWRDTALEEVALARHLMTT